MDTEIQECLYELAELEPSAEVEQCRMKLDEIQRSDPVNAFQLQELIMLSALLCYKRSAALNTGIRILRLANELIKKCKV